ncbi:MAG: efflux RND transporter periplasmic adaptor subunit [Deltaproteobacteria bacterium]|nr:efflux RND transporter periplasmic adaptor subunit [Deltaproteobacteria bacterium]
MGNKRWKIVLSILIVVSLSIILVIALKQKKTSVGGIKVISPIYDTVQTFISTTGTVQPQNRLEIKPPINGRVERVFVQEGERVTVGQTLALMSSTERAALLDAARAQGEETLAYWQEVYKPTPLIAPINGEVIVRAVEPGQTVTSGDAVIVLSDRLIVQAQVDETDIGKVRLGQAAIISLDAYPEMKVRATVDHIAYESKIVSNVTIYEVDILPEKVPPLFRSGMSATVDIIEQSKENILIIPIDAVRQDEEGSFVLISPGSGEKPVQRRVNLGISDEKNVEVLSGLDVKDKIIIETQTLLPSKRKGAGSSPLTPFGRKKR